MWIETEIIFQFLVAVWLWTLIWLERGIWASEKWDDVRTFSLVSFLWALATFISMKFSSEIIFLWVFAFIWALVAIYYFYGLTKQAKSWITTELAIITTFFLWVFVMMWLYKIALVLSIVITFLLSSKWFFKKITEKISIEELQNTIKFAVIALVILPMLPNEKYSIMDIWGFLGYEGTTSNWILNLDFFNPYGIWFFVVLMSGISYAWYIMSKLIWEKGSILASGAIWGLVSSTAVTASMTESSKKDEKNTDLYVVSTLIASTIMFIRVIIIVLFFNINMISSILLPSILMLVWIVSYIIFFYLKWRKNKEDTIIEQKENYKSPFSVWPALKFALFVLMIKFISWVWSLYQDVWWDYFFYALWIISGLADVDAISQTMSVDAMDWKVTTALAATTIIIAIISNNFVKWGLALNWNKKFGWSVMFGFIVSMLLWLVWVWIVAFM